MLQIEYHSRGGYNLQENRHHPLWNQSFQEYRKSIVETDVKIVTLGPAKRSPGFEKRAELKQHLKHLSARYDVAFPEELEIPSDALPPKDLWTAVDFVVADAQVIFALLIDHRDVTGVLAEVTRYEQRKGFRDKSYLIIPRKRTQGRRSSRSPQIWATARNYPSDHRLGFTDEEFEDCHKIRDYIGAVVDRYRKTKRWEEFMNKQGMNLFDNPR